ncbi:MAG: NAD(P)-dependent dehydrogenase (short-subunit alcohol dehydrogenase family) [Candidatus Azotimanducaceae bacterium]|jgi:NAD(P)-dependent dehydrogenase (short-subunit alcohol dehydrogenase family)
MLVMGVGDATGQAICRLLSGKYTLAIVARSSGLISSLAAELKDTHAYACDVSDRESWAKTLKKIVSEVGLPQRILMNTESSAWGEYNELSLDRFAASFNVNAVSLLQTVQVLFPAKEKISAGTRVMISSSPAAYNPPASFLGLAPSRVAQRVMAELLNENLSAFGLQFTVFAIDGAIDEPNMRAMFPDKPTTYFIPPRDIANEMSLVFDSDSFPVASGISGESSFAKVR